MTKFLLCSIACAAIVGSSAADAQTRARGQSLNASTRAAYAQAWRECLGQYAGYRGPAGSMMALPAFEACFQQKTGRWPFQVLRQ